MAVFRIQELSPTGEVVVESTLTLAQLVAAVQGAAGPAPAPPVPHPNAWPASPDEDEIDRLYKSLTRDLARPYSAEQFNHRDELARGRSLTDILAGIRERFPQG